MDTLASAALRAALTIPLGPPTAATVVGRRRREATNTPARPTLAQRRAAALTSGEARTEIRDGVTITVYPAEGRYSIEPDYIRPRITPRNGDALWCERIERLASIPWATDAMRRAEQRRRTWMAALYMLAGADTRPNRKLPSRPSGVLCAGPHPEGATAEPADTADLHAYFGPDTLTAIAVYRRQQAEAEKQPPSTHDGRHGATCRRCVAAWDQDRDATLLRGVARSKPIRH